MIQRVNVDLIGNKESIGAMLQVLSAVNHYCLYGASRTITLNVDGDGSARLKAVDTLDGEEVNQFKPTRHDGTEMDDCEISMGE